MFVCLHTFGRVSWPLLRRRESTALEGHLLRRDGELLKRGGNHFGLASATRRKSTGKGSQFSIGHVKVPKSCFRFQKVPRPQKVSKVPGLVNLLFPGPNWKPKWSDLVVQSGQVIPWPFLPKRSDRLRSKPSPDSRRRTDTALPVAFQDMGVVLPLFWGTTPFWGAFQGKLDPTILTNTHCVLCFGLGLKGISLYWKYVLVFSRGRES